MSAPLPAAFGTDTPGSRLYREGRVDECIEAFRLAAEREPHSATAACLWYGIGTIREHQGDTAAALQSWRRVMDDSPASYAAVEAARKRVELLERMGDWDGAAGACADRLCLLAAHWPWLLEPRLAQEIVERLADAGRRAQPGRTREEILGQLLHDTPYRCLALREAAAFALGEDPGPGRGNLLRNPGFEADGRMVPREAPVGWRFAAEGPLPRDNHDGTIDAEFLKGHGAPRSGALCVGKHTHWGTARGVYVQRVRVVPGARYDCGVRALTAPAGEGQGRVRLGIDPAGGSDATAERVIWTAYRSTDGRYERVALEGEQAVTARADHLTLFLELRQDVRAAHNVMLFDDAFVVPAGTGEPEPEGRVQRPARPTPTPPACPPATGETRMGYDVSLLYGGLLLIEEPPNRKIAKRPEVLETWRDETLPRICRQFRECGMVSARVGLSWYDIEHERGVYNWIVEDIAVTQLDAAGIVQVACVCTSPPWALVPGAVAAIRRKATNQALVGCTQIEPEYWADYEAYLERLVLRYRDCIDHWEIWNEPDGMAGHKLIRDASGEVVDVEFGGDPDWLAELLKRSARVIRALDPCAVIGMGGFEHKEPPSFGLLEALYARGGGADFDAMGLHTYGTPLHRDAFCLLREVMVAHGDANKPVWVTEYGLRAQKDVRQAYRLRRSLRALREIPYITIANGHIANMLFDSPHGCRAHREMTRETGPARVFAQDFEAPVAALLRDWAWDVHYDKSGWAEQDLDHELPSRSERCLRARSNGSQITHVLDVYVRPEQGRLSFLAYVDPPSATSPVTLEVRLEPGDVCVETVRIPVFPEGMTPRSWVRVEVDLNESAPHLVGRTILALFLRAEAAVRAEWTFAVDDIRLE